MRMGAIHPLLEFNGCKCTRCTCAAAAANAADTQWRIAAVVVVSEAHFTPNYGEKNSTKNSSDGG